MSGKIKRVLILPALLLVFVGYIVSVFVFFTGETEPEQTVAVKIPGQKIEKGKEFGFLRVSEMGEQHYSITEESFSVEISQILANNVRISGTAPEGLFEDQFSVIINGHHFTASVSEGGIVEEQSFELVPEVFFADGSAVDIKFGYTLNGVYRETVTERMRFILFDKKNMALAVPDGTMYFTRFGTLREYEGSGIPVDMYVNIAGVATMFYRNSNVKIIFSGGNPASENIPDVTKVGGLLYDMSGDYLVFTAVGGVEYNLKHGGELVYDERVTEDNGRITFTGLVPGEEYILTARSPEGNFTLPSEDVDITSARTLSSPENKDAFDAVYEELCGKLYPVSGSLTATKNEIRRIYDSYSTLTSDEKAIPAVMEKGIDVEVSKFLSDHAETIGKENITISDKPKILAALNAYDEISVYGKEYLEAADVMLLDKYRRASELTISSSEGLDESGDGVKDIANGFISELSKEKTVAGMDMLVSRAGEAILGAQKEGLASGIENEYSGITSSAEYASFTERAKATLEARKIAGVTSVTDASRYSHAKSEKEKALGALSEALEEARAEAAELERIKTDRENTKRLLDEMLGEGASDEMKEIIRAAKEMIDSETGKDRMDAILGEAAAGVRRQNAKEAVSAYIDSLGLFGEDTEAIREAAEAAIEAAQTEEETARAVARAKAKLDVTRAYLDLTETVKPKEKNRDLKFNTARETYLDALSRISSAEPGTEMEELLPILLNRVKNCLDEIIASEPHYPTLLSKYVSEKKEALKKLGNESTSAVINKALTALDGIVYAEADEGDDPEIYFGTLKARVDGIYAAVLSEIELILKKADAISGLASETEKRKNSGRYSEEQIKELEAALSEAAEKINALEDISGIDALVSEALGSISSVNVVRASTGAGTEFIATVTNENGFPSNISLSIRRSLTEKTGLTDVGEDGVSAVTGNYSPSEALGLVRDKKVFLTLDITLYGDGASYSGEGNGIYTVEIELPEELEGVSGLTVVSSDENGKLCVYETVIENGRIVFRTTHFSEYSIIGDISVDLLWVAFILAALIAAEAVFTAVFILKRKEKQKIMKTLSVVPMLVVNYLPNGIVTAIIVLGIIVVGGAVAVAVSGAELKKAEKLLAKALDPSAPPEKEEKLFGEIGDAEEIGEETVSEFLGYDDISIAGEPTETETPFAEEYVPVETEEEAEENYSEPYIPEDVSESEWISGRSAETAAEDEREDFSDSEKVFSDGGRVYAHYDYSFDASLATADEAVRKRYFILSELIVSYGAKKAKTRKAEHYYLRGKIFVSMFFRGKTLSLSLAITPESLEGTRFIFENVGGIPGFAGTPVMLRIRSGRMCRYAYELIGLMFMAAKVRQKSEPPENFVDTGKEDLQVLLDGEMITVTLEKDGETVQDNGTLALAGGGLPVRKSVSAEDVVLIPDAEAESFVESETVRSEADGGRRRRGSVNLERISLNFESGEEVTVKKLRERKLIAKSVNSVKILAVGNLDKPLTVKADDFSMDAVKMIVIAGGRAIKLKSSGI